MYIKQRDNFRCGPVLVLNTLRWAGLDVPYNYVYDLTEKCECTVPEGTQFTEFNRTLREEAEGILDITMVRRPSITRIEEHLHNGGAVAVNFKTGSRFRERHYALLTDVSAGGKYFGVVNGFSNRPAYTRMSRERLFRQHLLAYCGDSKYKAWLLSKADE